MKLTRLLGVLFAITFPSFFVELAYGISEVPFAIRYSTTARGNIDIFGNTNRAILGGAVFDIDDDSSTTNSTSADVSLPAGSSVLFAGLYWTGATGFWGVKASVDHTTVKFKAPGDSSYRSIVADVDAIGGGYYSSFEDVTSIVSASGNGTYFVADIVGSSEIGWNLVIVYGNPAETPRTMIVYDGAIVVSGGNNRTIDVSGFLTPPSGTVNATVGMIAVQGQVDISGDGATFAGVALSNAVNPVNNFFNGTYSKYGENTTNKNPDTKAHYNIDSDLITVSGALGNSVTSTAFAFTSTGDYYIPSVLTLAIDTYEPSFTGSFLKGVVDVNGGSVQSGDTLYYEFTIENVGNDPSSNTILSDVIPTGVTYVPGSLQIVDGIGVGSFTDASGDDVAEVSGTTVTFRVGTGATSSSGGVLQPEEKVKVRFAVTVDSATAIGSSLLNAASLTFVGVSSGASKSAQSEAIPGGETGDALAIVVGSPAPTPVFTPYTGNQIPTPVPTATTTPVATRTATATPTSVPEVDSCPLKAPRVIVRGDKVKVNFSRKGTGPRNYKIIISKNGSHERRWVTLKAGKEIPMFKGVRAGAWTARYYKIEEKKRVICSKATTFDVE